MHVTNLPARTPPNRFDLSQPPVWLKPNLLGDALGKRASKERQRRDLRCKIGLPLIYMYKAAIPGIIGRERLPLSIPAGSVACAHVIVNVNLLFDFVYYTI